MMVKKETKSPQEKKKLSLEKDRRNSYGESDKGARSTIPNNKKRANRSVRRVDKLAIMQDPETADSQLDLNLKRRWKKAPDSPLGEMIDFHKASRVDRVDGKARRKIEQEYFGKLSSKDQT